MMLTKVALLSGGILISAVIIAKADIPVLNSTETEMKILDDWWREMAEFKPLDCQANTESVIQEKMVEIVDCEEEGARFDYVYSGNKKENVFWGEGTIKMLSNGREGMKTGRCVLLFHPEIIKVKGNFENDLLQGNFMTEFSNGTILLGFASNGRITGVKRYFDNNGNILSIEMGNQRGTEKWTLENIIRRDDTKGGKISGVLVKFDQVYFVNKMSLKCDLYVGKDTVECHKVNVELITHNCFIQVRVLDEEPGTYFLNLKSLKLLKTDNQNIFSFECNDNWQYHHIRDQLENWIEEVSSQKDPFIEKSAEEPLQDGFTKFDTSGLEDNDKNGKLLRDGYFKIDLRKLEAHKNISKFVKFVTKLDNRISSDDDLSEQFYMEGRAKHGVVHGAVRQFGRQITDPSSSCHRTMFPGLAFVGRYKNGRPSGVCWRGLVGDAWLYGEVDHNGAHTGNNIAYVYPDLKTALLGTFKDGLMVKARKVRVIGVRCEAGIMHLKFSNPSGPEFHYDPPTKDSFGDQPLVRGPLETEYIYLAQSIDMPLAGEGAFAARDIDEGTIVSLYGGRRVHSNAIQELQKSFVSENNVELTDEKFLKRWMNLHTVAECDYLQDIPPEFASTDKYEATLGHKINHKFTPNVFGFHMLDSARFGPIGTMRTIRDINEGEELFNNYGYNVDKTHLDWYKKVYQEHLEQQKQHVP